MEWKDGGGQQQQPRQRQRMVCVWVGGRREARQLARLLAQPVSHNTAGGADHPRSERASGGATSFPLAEHGILCSHTCCCCLQLCMCVRLLQKALLWVVKRVQKGGALLESQDMDGGVGSRTSSVWRRLQFPPKSALAQKHQVGLHERKEHGATLPRQWCS
jgi:hypothetical protein